MSRGALALLLALLGAGTSAEGAELELCGREAPADTPFAVTTLARDTLPALVEEPDAAARSARARDTVAGLVVAFSAHPSAATDLGRRALAAVERVKDDPRQWLDFGVSPDATFLLGYDASGNAERVEIGCAAGVGDALTSAAQFVHAVNHLGRMLGQPERYALLGTLGARLEEIDARAANGLPMWPHEHFVNDLMLARHFRTRGDYAALPDWQLVLLHPSPGFVARYQSTAQGTGGVVLAVEALGIVRYRDPLSKDWWGISLFAHTNENAGYGRGILLRKGRYALGVSRSRLAGGRHVNALVFSLELADLVERNRARLETARDVVACERDALRAAIREIRPPTGDCRRD